MPWRRLGASVILVAASAAVVVACKEEGLANGQQCYPGDLEYADASAAGVPTFVRCADDGSGYAPYDAGASTGSDASTDADFDADAANDASDASTCDPSQGPLAFMCPGCTEDDQCASGRCYPFTNKGAHCSHPCKSAVDCPYPSGGCGNTGFCKPQ